MVFGVPGSPGGHLLPQRRSVPTQVAYCPEQQPIDKLYGTATATVCHSMLHHCVHCACTNQNPHVPAYIPQEGPRCPTPLNRLSFRLSCLLRPSAPPRLGFQMGAGVWSWLLGFSCICAARVPVAPAVGAVPLCLVPRWHRGRCDVHCCVG